MQVHGRGARPQNSANVRSTAAAMRGGDKPEFDDDCAKMAKSDMSVFAPRAAPTQMKLARAAKSQASTEFSAYFEVSEDPEGTSK